MSYPPYPMPPNRRRGRSPAAVVGSIAAVVMLVVGGVTVGALLAQGDNSAAADGGSSTASTPPSDANTGSATDDSEPSTDATDETTTDDRPPGYPWRYCIRMTTVQSTYTDFDFVNLTMDELDSLISDLIALKKTAPSEVREDLKIFSTGLVALQGLLIELDLTVQQLNDATFLQEESLTWTPGQRTQVLNVSDRLVAPNFVQAGEHLDSHFRTDCFLQEE